MSFTSVNPEKSIGMGDLDLLKLPAEAWRPFEASAQRRAERTGEREIEKVPAWIRSAKYREWTSVRLWDYSPFGFGIQYLFQPDRPFSALAGEKVEVQLGLYGHTALEIPCRVENTSLQGKGVRIGLSRLDLQDKGVWGTTAYPKNHIVDENAPLQARVANPILYNEWAEVRLCGLGPGGILVFSSQDSALLLLRGCRMNMVFDLPVTSAATLTGEVLWARGLAFDSPEILFAVTPSDLSFEIANAIGEHFLEAGICTPAHLAEYGLRMKRFKEQFRFRFASTLEEYAQIIDLRRTAYVKAGKLSSDTPSKKETSDFDGRSRLLAAYHQDVLVASVALSFVGNAKSPSKAELVFPGQVVPVPIPPKECIIEVHSLCTHSDYRGGDLIQGMFEHIARSLILSDRQWLLTFTTAELWPLYRRIGFRKTGASAAIQSLGGIEHHMILLHRNNLISGVGMAPTDWNYFFGELARDLLEKNLYRPSLYHRARIGFYLLFEGITRLWLKNKLEREFQAFLEKGPKK